MYEELIQLRDTRTTSLNDAKEKCKDAITDVRDHMDAAFGTVEGCSLQVGNTSGLYTGQRDGLLGIQVSESSNDYDDDITVVAEATIVVNLGDSSYFAPITAAKGAYSGDSVKITVPTNIIEDGRLAVPVCVDYNDDEDSTDKLQSISDAVTRELMYKIRLK